MLGHDTSVITSTVIPSYVGNLNKDFGDDPKDVKVIRLKPKFTLGQIVIARGIKREINKLNPDLVIVIGLGKAFPKPVFSTKFATVTLLGDNAHSYANLSFKTKILFSLFKKSTYRKAIRRSANLIAYTPQSFEAAAKMMGGKDAEILRNQTDYISLGFWGDEFYFSSLLRTAKRAELGYNDEDNVIITATRVVPEKNLEAVIPLLAETPFNVKWLIVGSAGDDYAKELNDYLQTFIGKNRVRILGYADKHHLNALYNAADMALYTVPAISIFEAIGTGLRLIAGEDKSLQHLRNTEYFFSSYRGVSTELYGWGYVENEPEEVRMQRSTKAKAAFGWEKIAGDILNIADKSILSKSRQNP